MPTIVGRWAPNTLKSVASGGNSAKYVGSAQHEAPPAPAPTPPNQMGYCIKLFPPHMLICWDTETRFDWTLTASSPNCAALHH